MLLKNQYRHIVDSHAIKCRVNLCKSFPAALIGAGCHLVSISHPRKALFFFKAHWFFLHLFLTTSTWPRHVKFLTNNEWLIIDDVSGLHEHFPYMILLWWWRRDEVDSFKTDFECQRYTGWQAAYGAVQKWRTNIAMSCGFLPT